MLTDSKLGACPDGGYYTQNGGMQALGGTQFEGGYTLQSRLYCVGTERQQGSLGIGGTAPQFGGGGGSFCWHKDGYYVADSLVLFAGNMTYDVYIYIYINH